MDVDREIAKVYGHAEDLKALFQSDMLILLQALQGLNAMPPRPGSILSLFWRVFTEPNTCFGVSEAVEVRFPDDIDVMAQELHREGV